MIKGAQKQMIVIRTGDSRYFDEAYFVLRREVKDRKKAHRDLLAEAGRILEEHDSPTSQHPPRKKRGIFLFLAGIVCGGGVAVLLCLLLL